MKSYTVGETKLLLFAYGIIVFVKKIIGFYRWIVVIMSKFDNVIGYKVSIYFIYVY